MACLKRRLLSYAASHERLGENMNGKRSNWVGESCGHLLPLGQTRTTSSLAYALRNSWRYRPSTPLTTCSLVRLVERRHCCGTGAPCRNLCKRRLATWLKPSRTFICAGSRGERRMTKNVMDIEISEIAQLQLATDTGQLCLDCPGGASRHRRINSAVPFFPRCNSPTGIGPGSNAVSFGNSRRRSAAVRRSTLRRNRRFKGFPRGCSLSIIARAHPAF